MKPLYGFTPHRHLSDNPLFLSEARRQLWGENARSLVSYCWACLLGVCGGVLTLWLLLVLADADQDVMIGFTALLVGLSLLAALALDYTCMASALSSINGEIAAKHWDLLRLTSLSSEQIMVAKHGMAQVRTWRLTIFIITLRAAASLCIVLTFGLLLYEARPLNVFAAIDVVLLGFGYGWIVLFMLAVYIVEPWWRMHAITALGIAISARVKQPFLGLWAAVAALAAFWLAQAIITTLLGGIFWILASQLLEFNQPNLQMSACVPLIFLGLSLWVVYGFYALVQSWSLRHAEGWIAQIL